MCKYHRLIGFQFYKLGQCYVFSPSCSELEIKRRLRVINSEIKIWWETDSLLSWNAIIISEMHKEKNGVVDKWMEEEEKWISSNTVIKKQPKLYIPNLSVLNQKHSINTNSLLTMGKINKCLPTRW